MKNILFATAFLAIPAFAQEEGATGGGIMAFLPFILMFVAMYIFFMLPKQKEMKKQDAMRNALKKGDKVLTAAGIIGVVVSVDNAIVSIKTGDNTKLDFEKNAILRVLEKKEGEEETKSEG
ncbi:MAG: preprotein translocase subunit YajC [Fibrobacter sp.]|jgi:preprotein translocase subunit YajC|nr:preprotein translocase subunit YajC [Fibrobacter sp.]